MNCHLAPWADILIKNVHACFRTRLVSSWQRVNVTEIVGVNPRPWRVWLSMRLDRAWSAISERHLRSSDDVTFSGWKINWNRAQRVAEWADTRNDKNKHDINHLKQKHTDTLYWHKINSLITCRFPRIGTIIFYFTIFFLFILTWLKSGNKN